MEGHLTRIEGTMIGKGKFLHLGQERRTGEKGGILDILERWGAGILDIL